MVPIKRPLSIVLVTSVMQTNKNTSTFFLDLIVLGLVTIAHPGNFFKAKQFILSVRNKEIID